VTIGDDCDLGPIVQSPIPAQEASLSTELKTAAAPAGPAYLEPAPTLDRLRAELLDRNPAFDPATLRQIAIIGAAPEGRRLAALCRQQGIVVAAIADDDPSKIGTLVFDRPVVATSELAKLDRSTPIVIASHRVLEAVERFLSLGFTAVAPFALLQVLGPDRFPPHMFYDGLLEDALNQPDQYRWLEHAVADERSRRVLDAVLGFRRTLDPRRLGPVIDRDLYDLPGLLRYADDEVYVDGGAFDGDTVRLFQARTFGRFERIYAFEPDPETFVRLRQNFATEPRVEPINAGLHCRKGALRFRDDASRGAIFAPDGEVEIDVTTIDDVLGDRPVTFIKMNIEGAEIDALHGAAQAIRRWRPKLAISAYHRPSDLWRIPRLVRELNADYRLYLRQHDGGVIETVLYALPSAAGPAHPQ
jgi:FkbM family methyltransferase